MPKPVSFGRPSTAAVFGAGLLVTMAICPASVHAASSPIVITDPNAVVLGLTINNWTTEYIRWAFANPAGGQPAGSINAFSDPDGSYAETYNFGPVFFVTGGAPSSPPLRTLKVPHGTILLFPIATVEDTEGPSIPSSIHPNPCASKPLGDPCYAQEVKTVLENSSFTDVSLKIDGQQVENLQNSMVPTFFAGVVTPGSEGQVFFTGPPGLKPGTLLTPSGTEGYWVMIAGLTLGKHQIDVGGYTFTSPYLCPLPQNVCPVPAHTEFIEVGGE